MIYTTLNKILAAGPCGQEVIAGRELRGWLKLLHYLNKTESDDEPLGFDVILKSNGFKDALWCSESVPEHNSFWRLLAVKFARTIQHLMIDKRSLEALAVAERHANGNASDEELESAKEAAYSAWLEVRAWASVAKVAAARGAWEAVAAAETAAAETAGEAARAAAWEAVAAAWEAVAAGEAAVAAWAAAETVWEKLEKIFIDALKEEAQA